MRAGTEFLDRARSPSPPPSLLHLCTARIPSARQPPCSPTSLVDSPICSCASAHPPPHSACTQHPFQRTIPDSSSFRFVSEFPIYPTDSASFRFPEFPVCDAWTGAPPFSSNLCVRLCGASDCTALMFSNAYSRREGCSEDEDLSLPTEASYWLPYLHVIGPTAQPPSRGSCVWYGLWPYLQRRDCRYLLCNIRQAFDELCSLDGDCRPSDGAPAWSLSSCPQSDGIDDLLEKYGTRAIAHEAMETIFLEIAEWRQGNQVASAPIREANLHTLRTVVNDLHMDFGLIRKDPLTQRILAAHARDLALVCPSTFLYLSSTSQSESREVQAEDAEATVASSEGDLSDGAGASEASSSHRPSRLKERRAKPDRKARKQRKLAQARFACSECLHTQFTTRAALDQHMSESHGEPTSSSCCVA
ncbi:hypothetical protein EV121DRAFT_283643 [Schizophyllum commune]